MSLYTGHRKSFIGIGTLIVLAGVLIAARLYLGVWLLGYVNRALNETKDYQGSVEAIDIELYRGAYKIHGLKLLKKEGAIPTPFVAIDTVDLSIQWRALFHGKVVSDIDLEKPVLNFAVNKSAKQTGTNEDWTKPIKDLAPIDINHISFRNGKLTYQDFSSDPNVDIYIHHMSGEVRNLRNVVDKAQKLPSTVVIKGDSIGGGAFESKGRLNILKEVPDMDLQTQLVNMALPALNSYSNAYAALDFKGGTLSVYSQLVIDNGNVSGYVKPIARDISLVDLHKDSNPFKVAWEATASAIITLFSNHHKDQFATKVPLEGSLYDIQAGTFPAITAILGNAFVTAIKKGFDDDGKSDVIPDEKAKAPSTAPGSNP